MKTIKLVSIATLALAATVATTVARAEDENKFSLHLDPAFVAPVTEAQRSLYLPGIALEVKGLYALTPNVAVGPAAQALYVSRLSDSGSAGDVWQWGGSLRVQTDRTVKGNPKGVFFPWADVDVMVGMTGNLWRPAGDLAVGFDTALDSERLAWLGPFVRYATLLQTDLHQSGVLLDKSHPGFIEAGFEFSFDFPHHTKTNTVIVKQSSETIAYHQVIPKIEMTVVTTTPPVAPVSFDEKVQFAWDSSVLTQDNKDKLDAVATKILANATTHVKAEGNASSEGQLLHNIVLAGARAQAVIDYLGTKGVNASQLELVNFGIEHPVADNATEEGRVLNRRVDFEVSFTATPTK